MRNAIGHCCPKFIMVSSEFLEKTVNVLTDFDFIKVSKIMHSKF